MRSTKRDYNESVSTSQSNNSFFMTPRKETPSLCSAVSAASMTTSSEQKRQKKMNVALNGEVRVMSKGLSNAGYDKTPTQRIDEAVSKVESLAELEPDLEVKMS